MVPVGGSQKQTEHIVAIRKEENECWVDKRKKEGMKIREIKKRKEGRREEREERGRQNCKQRRGDRRRREEGKKRYKIVH